MKFEITPQTTDQEIIEICRHLCAWFTDKKGTCPRDLSYLSQGELHSTENI